MLYWLDAGLQRIERCDFNGNEREKVFDIPSPGAMDLLIDGEYLYYSTTSNKSVFCLLPLIERERERERERESLILDSGHWKPNMYFILFPQQ